MRRLIFGMALLGLLSPFVGCQSACSNCRGGRLHHSGRFAGHGGGAGTGEHHYRPATEPAGGPAPQYAYPYYTIRGPRDFLVDNPPSIGPY